MDPIGGAHKLEDPMVVAQERDGEESAPTPPGRVDKLPLRQRRRQKARPNVRQPVTQKDQLESKLWAARLGFCRSWQLAALPGKAEGISKSLECHPFCFIDYKEEAAIKK